MQLIIQENRMPVSYPERSEGRAAFRRVIEMLSQATPVTAALSHLYGYTHPSQFERDLERFQREVAATVNDHGERLTKIEAHLAPRATLSTLALDLAFYVLRTNTTGRGDPIVFGDLQGAFPDIEKMLLEEAVAELAHCGYATTNAAIGYPILNVRPTIGMFLAFDLAVTRRDTRADGVEIARLWLSEEVIRSIFQLSERLGWEPRRLNPALCALRPVFPDGRWSREIHPTLATTSVLITPDERFKLRQIVESGRVD
jgi:hypothetical protein